MSKNLVVKDNALINASYNLELSEQRLILLSIVEARAEGAAITPERKILIPAASYMANFGTGRNAAYGALKDACNNLFRREFSYIEKTAKGEKVVRSRWVSSVAYIEKEAAVELVFAPAVAPLITLLEKNFTSYELEQVSALDSKYAVRLYEVLISWRGRGRTPLFSLSDIRGRLGVLEDEYAKMEVFKRRVLDFAVRQINERTDISVGYRQEKEGRKIVGFVFEIVQRKKAPVAEVSGTAASESLPAGREDPFLGLTDAERMAVRERIEAHIERLERKGAVVDAFHRQNITAKAVSERWGLEEMTVKAERAKKKKNETILHEAWSQVPDNTVLVDLSDGTEWVKEAGCLRNLTNNRVMPEQQAAHLFPKLTVKKTEPNLY